MRRGTASLHRGFHLTLAFFISNFLFYNTEMEKNTYLILELKVRAARLLDNIIEILILQFSLTTMHVRITL